MASENHKKIIIMGGGPAGVFCACGLVELGHHVTLITRPRPFPAWEGLSERPYASLHHFGFDETLASIGPMVMRSVHWNGQSRAQNREYIVDRRKFDRALLRDAENKGVEVIEGRIDRVERKKKGWRISYLSPEGQKIYAADFLVEARGRESKMGRQLATGDGDFTTAPATSALLKSYDVSSDLEAMTSVASFPGGWAWYLRDGEGTAVLQIFVNSDKGELPPKTGLERFFLQLCRQLPETEDWLRGASAHDSGVSVRTAAANKTTPAGGSDFLVIGDGSLALDPLSGNGIFYAIGSGLAAAPVINSLLRRPQDRDLALSFFQERLDNAFKGGCQMGREFYATEQRWPDMPYWKARQNWPEEALPSHPDPLSRPAAFCHKPVVKDGYIALENVIVTADHPRGVWQIDGVPLAGLVDQIRAGSKNDHDMAADFETATENVTRAREWLIARKIITGFDAGEAVLY